MTAPDCARKLLRALRSLLKIAACYDRPYLLAEIGEELASPRPLLVALTPGARRRIDDGVVGHPTPRWRDRSRLWLSYRGSVSGSRGLAAVVASAPNASSRRKSGLPRDRS